MNKLLEAIKSSDLFQPVGDEEASKREAVAVQKVIDSFDSIYEIDKRAARDYINFDKISKKQSITYKLGDFGMQFSDGGMTLQIAHNNPVYLAVSASAGQYVEMRFGTNISSEKLKFGILSDNSDSVTGKILRFFNEADVRYVLRSHNGLRTTVAEKYIEYVRKREGIKE